MRVLLGCEFSGVVRDAFACRGHDAWSCDLLPSETPGQHIVGDVRDYLNDGWDLFIAHPPCTRLANSGVRWLSVPPRGRTLKEMWEELDRAAAFYRDLQRAPIPRKGLENPIMHRYARERIPLIGIRQIIQPWHFGVPAFKATGLELINLPLLKPTDRLVPPAKGTREHAAWSQVHRESPGPDRWKNRSRTYRGIAEAMAQQWGNLLREERAA